MTVLTINQPKIKLHDGKMATTSLNVSEVFNRRHKDVIRKIENLECSQEFNERNFTPVDYTDKKGEARKAYEITRDGFTFLAMGFTGKKAAQFKEAYIEAFNQMEAKLLKHHTQTAVPIERISPEQKGALQSIMSARCAEVPAEKQGSVRSRLWKMINSMCGVNSYHEIPSSRFLEVREALLSMQPVQLNTYQQPAIEQRDFHYPAETAKVPNMVGDTCWLTYKNMSDERWENPLQGLLNELQAKGYDIGGAKIVYAAMRHNMEVCHNTFRRMHERAYGGMGVGLKYNESYAD